MALSAPTALPRSATALFKRFISPSACRHTPDTWTRYGCVPKLDLVKYTKCGARETRLPRHPDVPDTATRLHTVTIRVLRRHATHHLTEVTNNRSLSDHPASTVEPHGQ